MSQPADPVLSKEDMAFLEGLASAVLDASRVPEGEKVGGIGPNVTGNTLIRPGGRDCYPAFWIRDYAMSLESGLVTPEEQRHALLLTARLQQPKDWSLPSGSFVPKWAIADHVSFGGKPIFYPGTLEDFEGQGGKEWGYLPSLDDHYFFIHMAAFLVETTGDSALLRESVEGVPLLERLGRAYDVPPSRPDTGLVYATDENRGVTFGFVDVVTHTGDLLFCSLLKCRAALELAQLHAALGDTADAARWAEKASALKEALNGAFAMDDGWLRASTGVSGQPDVWGTAFAVYIGALHPDAEAAACRALADAFRNGTIAWQGNIRHVPTDRDFSSETAWESALAKKNTYQNGAYWGTPTGWVCYAIHKTDPDAARQLAREYVAELREGDFRKGPEFGSPWECMHPDGRHRQNPVYLTSVTCPLATFRAINEARNQTH